jgi:chromosome partitioning protein
MPTVIAFVSQKGGVGKSTLARALAREVTANSKLKVRLTDLDTTQKTTSDWHAKRLEAGLNPVGDVQILATINQVLAGADGYDLVIIDAPARAPTGTRDIAKHADLVVQPSGPADDDLTPAIREFHGLVKAGIPKARLAFALNHVTTDAEEQAARNLIGETGYHVLDGSLSERAAYRTAHNYGRSITETNFKTLNTRADALIQSLINKVTNNG